MTNGSKVMFLETCPTGHNAKQLVAAANERKAAQKEAVHAAFFPYAAIGKKEERKEQVVPSEFYAWKQKGIAPPKAHVFVAGTF